MLDNNNYTLSRQSVSLQATTDMSFDGLQTVSAIPDPPAYTIRPALVSSHLI